MLILVINMFQHIVIQHGDTDLYTYADTKYVDVKSLSDCCNIYPVMWFNQVYVYIIARWW